MQPLFFAADNCLVRSVDIGDPYLRYSGQHGFHAVEIRLHRRHDARFIPGSFKDEAGPDLGQGDEVFFVHGPGHAQGDIFAVAVARRHVRDNTQAAQQMIERQIGSPHGRLRGCRLGQGDGLGALPFLGKELRREDDGGKRFAALLRQQTVAALKERMDKGKLNGRFRQHVDIL